MTKRVTLPAGGLATDPNPFITAAQGAMRRADEVIFKHPNVASLRPSFPVTLSKVTARRPRTMHVFNGTPVVASVDGSTYHLETVADTLDTDAEPPDEAISPTQFVEARSNLYYSTYRGIRKVTSPSAPAEPAGLREVPSAAPTPSTAAGSVLPTGFVWAYRACIVREDASGVVVRSAPSPWFTYENASGSGVVATWSIPLAGDVVAGDVLELYRSLAVATGSTPSDVLFLSNRTAITSTHVTNGVATIADLSPEAELGAELYTNSTREGAIKANYQPAAAVALERYASCIWYGNTTERQTLGFQFKRAMASSVASSNANGVCAGTRDATGTVGNAFFTMAGGTGGIHIGMYVWDAADPETVGTYFDARTTVTSIVGTTVGISEPLVGSPAGATVNIGDGVEIDGALFYAVPAASWTAGSLEFPVYVTGDHAYDVGKMAQGLAYNVTVSTNQYAYATEDALTAGSVVVRNKAIDGAAFSISWTTDANSASEGSIVSLASDLSQTSSALIKPHRIYYSKPDEPEHVPVINYISVGDESAPIYAMRESRGSLLVFKSDGVWKVTGSAPDSWRIDRIDSTTRVLRGSCVAEMGGLVYAWTNKGAVAVSELGVQPISARAISRELDDYAFHMSEEPTTAGAWVSAWPDTGLVMFGVPSGEGSASTSHVYVFSESTGRWSRWAMSTYCAAHDRDSIAFYFANEGAWRLAVNSIGATDAGTTGYDTLHALSAWSVAGTSVTVTYAVADAWVPAVGDWLSVLDGDDTEYREIVGVEDDGVSTYTLTISTAFGGLASSGMTAYEGVSAALEWQPHTAPEPFATALWREVQVAIEADGTSDASIGDLRWTLGASNEHVSEPSTLAATSTRSVPAHRRTTLRASIPRAVARGAECSPYLSGSNLLAPWHCRGVTVVFTPDGGDAERTTR